MNPIDAGQSRVPPDGLDRHCSPSAEKTVVTNHLPPDVRVYDETNEFESGLRAVLSDWNARGDRSCSRYMRDLKARKWYTQIYDSWRRQAVGEYLKTNSDADVSRNRVGLRNVSMPDKLLRLSKCERTVLNEMYGFATKTRGADCTRSDVRFVDVDYVGRNTTAVVFDSETRFAMEKESTERTNRRHKADLTGAAECIVRELVDLGVATARCRVETRCDHVATSFLQDCAELFVTGQSLPGDPPGGLVSDPDYGLPDAIRPILNRRDVVQYVTGAGRWSDRESNAKRQPPPDGPAGAFLGFLVYDVLAPFRCIPSPSRPPSLGPTAGVLEGAWLDDKLAEQICSALSRRNVLAVRPTTALLYCLTAYCRQTDGEQSSRNLNDTDRCGGGADDAREMSQTIVANSKQTQTPENISTNYDSERVECGKKVFVNIYKGKSVPKHNLVDCALCYIRENDTRAGCVLVGFLREEIAIVEQRLAEKRYPPYGPHWYAKNENLSVLVPFEGVGTSDEGRYASSFHSYLKILSRNYGRGINDGGSGDNYENDTFKYYRSRRVLTLLRCVDNMDIHTDDRKVELLCDVLTGKIVDWSKEIDWVDCVCGLHHRDESTMQVDSFMSGSVALKWQASGGLKRRGRLYENLESDTVDSESIAESYRVSDSSSTGSPEIVERAWLMLCDMRLNDDAGVVLRAFWTLLESRFVERMEDNLFSWRKLVFQQESFEAEVDEHVNDMLNVTNPGNIELVNRLQSDLSCVPGDALRIPGVVERLWLAVFDVRNALRRLTYAKIEKCRRFMEHETVKNWLDRQVSSMMTVYDHILQTEVDRAVHTLVFINAYMFQLYVLQFLPPPPPPPLHVQIDVPPSSSIASGAAEVRIRSTPTVGDHVETFRNTVQWAVGHVKDRFSTMSEWLIKVQEARSSCHSEKVAVCLNIWKCLVKIQGTSSVERVKLISDRFYKDMQEMENWFVRCQSDTFWRIDDRLRYELFGIDHVCDLFTCAIDERRYVRHEILLIDGRFYLNPENVLYSDVRPPQPFPLLEPDDIAINVDDLETMTGQLAAISPNRHISLTALSGWLTNYAKRLPRLGWWLNVAPQVLRTMFGSAVHYVDWSDFVVRCLNLPFPSAEHLSELQRQYAALELNRAKTMQCPDHVIVKGIIDVADFDSVPLWYQQSLPADPVIHLRYAGVKRILSSAFAIAGDRLDYITMLLALCRDDCPVAGLKKATRLLRVAADATPETSLYHTLVVCLKNYTTLVGGDLDDLTTSIWNAVHESSGDVDGPAIKSLCEIGYRFSSTPRLSDVVYDLQP